MNKKNWDYIDENRNIDYVKILKSKDSFKDYINGIKEEFLEYVKPKNIKDFEDLFKEEITEDLNSHLIYDYQYQDLINYFGINAVEEKLKNYDFDKIRPPIYLLLEERIYEKLDELNFFDKKNIKREIEKQVNNQTKTLKMRCK